jgi:cation diffusion facilitator CzcD-associated flavoprotein CzcO
MARRDGGRVCVVGAGIAGLVTAKVLHADGFDVAVFETGPTLGGVWAPSRTYPGLRANNSRDSYAFSDHPYPASADDFPTAEQIRAYLESYAQRFGTRPLIRTSTEVVRVSRVPANAGNDGARFQVTIRPTSGPGAATTLPFDFVAVCNGVFSEPRLPQIEGRERFAGDVLHSSQLVDPSRVESKHVIVVGAGKSALDCATCTARHARSCTLVFRTAHWMMPRYFFGLVRGDRVIMTRFSELFLRYHRRGRIEALLHGPGRPFLRLFWRGLSRVLRLMLGMPPTLVPEQALPVGFENVGVGGEFYEVLRLGTLVTKRAQIAAFTGPRTVQLSTGERLDADVVVCATGWRQGIEFLDADLRALVRTDGCFRLYRHILPPAEQRLGFVGYASSTACQLTSEVAAHWLSQCFRGELSLPSTAEMEREISRVLEWASEVVPKCREGYFVGPFVAHYVDDLMRDMGLRRARTGNVVTEYFAPFWPRRYRDLQEERRRGRSTTLSFSDSPAG